MQRRRTICIGIYAYIKGIPSPRRGRPQFAPEGSALLARAGSFRRFIWWCVRTFCLRDHEPNRTRKAERKHSPGSVSAEHSKPNANIRPENGLTPRINNRPGGADLVSSGRKPRDHEPNRTNRTQTFAPEGPTSLARWRKPRERIGTNELRTAPEGADLVSSGYRECHMLDHEPNSTRTGARKTFAPEGFSDLR